MNREKRVRDMMNKTIFALAGLLTLTACGGGDSSETVINDVTPNGSVDQSEISRIAFDPSADEPVLPLPSDLLFSGTQDGTIEAPDETAAKDAGQAVDLSNPAAALGGADGWSTQMPMQISVDLADGATLDTSTLGPTTVLLVETDCALGLTSCTSFTPVTYGTYVGAGDESGTINIVPVVPLNPKTTYLVALTNGILDSRGEPVQQSLLYEQVTKDVSELDIEGDLGPLQDAINGYEQLISLATGVAAEDMIFTASWTTASVFDPLLAAVGVTQTFYSPEITGVAAHPFGDTAAIGGLGLADIYEGTITLPYFSPVPTVENPFAPLTDTWTALCDNGLALLGAVDSGVDLGALPTGDNHAICQGLPTPLGDYGLDTERYVTQYNPVPERTNDANEIGVLITVPKIGTDWPVVIFQHGITRLNTDMLAVADAFANAGFATVGIDLPLHGSRGFATGEATQINATTDETSGLVGDVTNYMNLGYLLTGRDNLRQSYVDMVGLRMGISGGFTCEGALTICDDIDTSEVHFVGLSLGGITGVGFNALATAAGVPVDSATYIAAGGGIVPLLLNSVSFGPVVQASVLDAAGVDASSPDAEATLSAFTFAAQTIIEPSDPNNLAATASSVAPTFLIQINGDSVVPNNSGTSLFFGGTEPLAGYLGVDQVVQGDAAATEGFVKFTEGDHSTLLSTEASAAATVEMQTQIATFLASGFINLGPSSVGLVE